MSSEERLEIVEIPVLEKGDYLAFRFNGLINLASEYRNYEGRNYLARAIFNSVLTELRDIRKKTMREFGEKDFENYNIVPSNIRPPTEEMFNDLVDLYNQKVKQYLLDKTERIKRENLR